MRLEDLIKGFLDYQKSKYWLKERTILRYKYILGVYSDYLFYKLEINSETIIPYLKGVNENHIFGALDYYIFEKNIESEDTARFFISVLKEFYRFVHAEKDIQNISLIETFGLPLKNINSFSSKVNNKIKELKKNKILKYGSAESAIRDEDFQKVLELCDKALKTDVLSENEYKNYLCALIVKLILYTGLSMREIYKIERNDMDLEHATITINGFIIHLPYMLHDQFRKYIRFIEKQVTNRKQSLFINLDGTSVNDNTEVGHFINKAIDTYSTKSLGKYTITEMIRNGINQSIIQSLTGYGVDVYEPCQEMVNIEKNNDKNRYLDSKLRGMPLYDIL